MKATAMFPLIVLAVACGDNAILQPVDPSQAAPALAAVASSPVQGGWQFAAVATPTGGVPGVFRITPGGVVHWTEIANEYEITGDLEGYWTWSGKAVWKDGKGKGPAIAESMRFDLTAPDVGTFDCRGTGMGENYPGENWTLAGPLVACVGGGAFEGKKLKAYATNQIGTAVFDIVGVIW
jgi:hypothetical protein